jgi:hypothetical protein
LGLLGERPFFIFESLKGDRSTVCLVAETEFRIGRIFDPGAKLALFTCEVVAPLFSSFDSPLETDSSLASHESVPTQTFHDRFETRRCGGIPLERCSNIAGGRSKLGKVDEQVLQRSSVGTEGF